MLSYLKQSKHAHPLSTYSALAFLVMAALTTSLSFLDPRELLGINLWIKPTKFWLSSAIFSITLPFYFRYTQGKVAGYEKIFVGVLWLENMLISIQAGRGQLSHFNTEDALGTVIFSVMGIAIVISTIVLAKLLHLLYQNRMAIDSKTFALLSWGIVLALAGSIGGGIMSGLMKHTIGAPDGGPGLPFVNWSTTAGDLRVMHFIGLHAFQFFPLLLVFFTKPSHLSFTKILAMAYTALFIVSSLRAFLGLPLF